MKLCNKCDTAHDTERDLCPGCHEQWESRVSAAAAAGLRRQGEGPLSIATTFEQYAINHEFRLGDYAPKR